MKKKYGINSFYYSINASIYLSSLLKLVNIAVCTAALLLFVSKIFFGREPETAIYYWFILYTAVGSLVIGLAAAYRKFYSWSDTEILFDYYGKFKGLFWMGNNLESVAESDWGKKLDEGSYRSPLAIPRFARMFKHVVPAIMLALIALLVPLNEKANPDVIKFNFENEELAAKEKMAVELKEAGALSQEELDKIQEEVERVRSKKTKRFSHERWEALDGIGERMKLKAEGNLSLKSWATSSAQELNREMNSDKKRSLSQLAKKTEELEKALKSLAEKGMLDDLPEGVLSVIGKGGVNLLNKDFKLGNGNKCSKKFLGDLDKFLSNSNSSRILDKYKLSRTKEGSLSLCSACNGKGCSKCNGTGKGNKPGKGGVDRGRGDAPMVWGDASTRDGAKFEPGLLPSGLRDPRNQGLIGVGLSLPEVKYTDDDGSAGAAAVEDTLGERAWQRDISPSHRKIIREFFSDN